MIRNIIKIDEDLCTGCGLCILDCAEGALRIENGKAKIIGDHLCDGLGNCLKCCPTGALTIIQREAPAFDEQAVEALLAENKKAATSTQAKNSHLCSGAKPTGMQATGGLATSGLTIGAAPQPFEGKAASGFGSSWPVKLRLASAIPAGADILICADCAPPVVNNFNERYFKNFRVLTVCPKFEDTGELANKLAQMFRQSPPKTVTALRLSVPCCKGTALLAEAVAKLAALPGAPAVLTVTPQGEIS